MRRTDREVRDVQEILSIIDRCDSCNLGLSQDDMPYVVPLNFGYVYENGKLVIYFHGAKEGKKHDIIKQNSKACFSMDCSHRLVLTENAETATMKYESVMGTGKIESVTDKEEKSAGLSAIMQHYSPGVKYELPDKVLEMVCILRLQVESFTGKRNMD